MNPDDFGGMVTIRSRKTGETATVPRLAYLVALLDLEWDRGKFADGSFAALLTEPPAARDA